MLIEGWKKKKKINNSYHFHYFYLIFTSYDESEGSPSEKGIQKDSEAILDYIFQRNDIDKKLVFTHGRSLGGFSWIKVVF